jgi:hypothetical protein
MGILFTAAAIVCVSAIATAKEGRWKLDGNGGCVFDATDDGPDQCSPTVGRWKVDGNGGCVFDASDSGPDQCTPPASEVPAGEREVSPAGAGERGPDQYAEIPR